MLKKDKIKLIIVLILFAFMAITFYFVGKESIIMKTVAGFCLIAWIFTLYFVNKKFK